MYVLLLFSVVLAASMPNISCHTICRALIEGEKQQKYEQGVGTLDFWMAGRMWPHAADR